MPVTAVTPAVTATTIDSSAFNSFTADLETALSMCLTEDGQNVATANLPMATHRHTGVGNAAALTDYAAAGQVVKNSLTYGGASSAGTDTYAISLSVSPGSYVTGSVYWWIADVENTGACTLNVSSLGAKNIKLQDGNDPYDGAIQAGPVATLYDGTNMVLLTPWVSLSGLSVTATAAELNVLDGVTAGTVTASLGVVVDASKDIGTFGTVTAATFSGALTGNITGNVTGNVTGDVTGNADTATLATSSNGLESATTTVVVSGATAPSAGQVLTATSDIAAEWQTPTVWTFETSVATTSGTTKELVTGLTGVTEFEILFSGVSTNTAAECPIVQLKDSSYKTSGYVGIVSDFNNKESHTDGFYTNRAILTGWYAASELTGKMHGVKYSGTDQWVLTWSGMVTTSTQISSGAGTITLSSAHLSAIRLNTPSGTATFDNGSAIVRWR